MTQKKKPVLGKSQPSNSLDTHKSIGGAKKQPGQAGLYAPNDLNAIRKPTERPTDGPRYFGGVSGPQVSDQTYDCYKPVKKNKK